MSWKMTSEPKVRKLTRSLAEEFAGMTPAPHDRPLNATRCAVIKRVFDMGKFRTCEWARAYCAETKQTYRINGKHTSTVLSQLNGVFPKELSVIVEEYHCDTMEDVANLYSTFDTRSAARSTGDINQIYAATCPELEEVSGKIINLVVAGVAYATWEEISSSKPAEERAALIMDNVEFCLFVNSLCGVDNKKCKHLMRVSVVAAMLKTFNKAKGAATEFWTAVRDETGTKPEHPDRKLAKFLFLSRIAARSQFQGKPVTVREMYVKCLHGWNAWRTNSPTNLNYRPDTKVPGVK